MTLFTSNPSKDTKINSGQPTRNYGVSTTILGGTTDKALFYFDLASIDAGDTCDDATLELYQAGAAAANAFTLTAYVIKSGNGGWIEGTKNNATAGAGEPCWDYKEYNTVGWAGSAGLGTSGTDYETVALGTVNGNRSDPNGTKYSIPLTAAAIQAMFANAANYGILVVTSSGCGAIASKEHATSGYRPVLAINHTATGGTVSGSGALSGAGNLVGQGVTISSGQGLLSGLNTLSGRGNTISQSGGQITGIGALAGAGSTASPASGMASGEGDLAGQGVTISPAVGALNGIGNLAGAGSTISSAAGLVSGAGMLTGFGVTVSGEIFTGAGVVGGTVTLSGSGLAIAYAGGSVVALGDLSGQGSSISPGSGALNGMGELAGAGLGVHPGGGAIGALGELAGSGNVVVSGIGLLSGYGLLTNQVDTTQTGINIDSFGTVWGPVLEGTIQSCGPGNVYGPTAGSTIGA